MRGRCTDSMSKCPAGKGTASVSGTENYAVTVTSSRYCHRLLLLQVFKGSWEHVRYSAGMAEVYIVLVRAIKRALG